MKQFLFVFTALATLAAGCTTTGSNNAAAPVKVAFLCDGGQNMAVRFDGNAATLYTGTASVALVQQRVASGISYAGGGNQLRGKGPQMTWTDASGTVHNCRDQKWAMNQPQIQEPVMELAGSKWRLVHFQSSDDAIGTVVPPDAENYTIEFMADGSLAMQLDCNRASAKWQVGQKTATGGSLAISPGPMTRAMCQPGAIDTRLAADMGHVRSFTMAGGQLNMALKADAGIYVWDPVPAS